MASRWESAYIPELARAFHERYPEVDLLTFELGLLSPTAGLAISSAFSRALQPLGIAAPRSHVLMTVFLSPDGCLSQREISDRLMVTGGNISQLVNALHKDGLVRRTVRRNNRRVTDIRLTPAGLEVCRQVLEIRGQFVADAWSVLDQDEKRALKGMLERLLTHAETLHAAPPEDTAAAEAAS